MQHSVKTAGKQVSRGLLLELEYLLWPGHHLIYDVMAQVLKSKEITLTPVHYARAIAHPMLVQGIENLLKAADKRKFSAEKITKEIQDQFLAGIQNSKLQIEPLPETLVAAALKAGFKVGLLSYLPQDVARQLLARCKFADAVTLQIMSGGARARFSAAGWIHLLKNMSVSAHGSVALCADAVSCRTVLVTGARCIVIPTDFTRYQDFSGADLVVDGAKAINFNEVVALLKPCSFR